MHPSARCEKTTEERIAPLVAIHRHRRKPPKNGCINVTLGCPIVAIHRHRRKTAEERFHTLARGWLAYPVTSMHAHLPPKSGCINVIPRFALSRRRATALFHNPVRKAQRSVPEVRHFPTFGGCLTHRPPSSSDCPIVAMHHRHRRKTAEERFHTLARGWLAYPVTPMHARLPPKSGCRSPWRAKKDRWLGFQPSVSVSLRSAVRLLVDNTTLFDTSLLACKVAQIVQFCTTHFTKLVDCDAVDKR